MIWKTVGFTRPFLFAIIIKGLLIIEERADADCAVLQLSIPSHLEGETTV